MKKMSDEDVIELLKKCDGYRVGEVRRIIKKKFNISPAYQTVKHHLDKHNVLYDKTRGMIRARHEDIIRRYAKYKTLDEVVEFLNKFYKKNFYKYTVRENLRKLGIEYDTRRKEQCRIKKNHRYNVYSYTQEKRLAEETLSKNLTYIKQDKYTLYFKSDKGPIITFPNHFNLTYIEEVQ